MAPVERLAEAAGAVSLTLSPVPGYREKLNSKTAISIF
jgi:hypothetical protein